MKILIYGASGQGRVTADLLGGLKKYSVVGFLDDDQKKVGEKMSGLPILGGESDLSRLKKTGVRGVVLAIGDGFQRERILKNVIRNSIQIIGFTHKTSFVSSTAYVDSTAMIFPQAVVNVGAVLGPSVIVNSNSTVEHDCRISPFVHIAPGATICGGVSIGERSWIGAGATVIQGITVGSDVMVGAGSVVTKDIPDGAVGMGVPFRRRT